MIGVCISTTPDRIDLFRETYAKWDAMMPDDSILTFVSDDDHSGVAKTKNASLALLEFLGVTEYFIVDNDVWPISREWHVPYVNSPEPHLLYNFKQPGKPKTDMQEIYRDENIVSYSHTRGCFIYVNQKVLDTVGGFDTRFYNGFEHPNYTNRIHNAGLTTHRSMDIPGSDRLLYSLDQDGGIESSIPKDLKQYRKNLKLYKESLTSKEYKELR